MSAKKGQGLIINNGSVKKRLAHDPFYRGIEADEGIVIARMCFDEPWAVKNNDLISGDLFEDVTWKRVLEAVKSDLEQHGMVDTENIKRAIEGTDPDRAHARMFDLVEYFCLADSAAEFALKKLLERRHATALAQAAARIHESVGTPNLSCEAAYGMLDDIRALYSMPHCANVNSWGECKPLSEMCEEIQPDWLWEGYLARGQTTLLTGLWKSGKTTLIGHLIVACGEGGHLARQIKPSRVLVVSEESGAMWACRGNEMGLGDHLELNIRPFKIVPSFDEWIKFNNWLASQVVEKKYDIVIYDPISAHWPVLQENDASQVNAAMKPVQRICEAGAALMLIHHPRKGDGDDVQSPRGSGALSAFCDLLVNFGKHNERQTDDCRRILKASGRSSDIPPVTVIELTDDGYKTLGTIAESTQLDRLEIIADLLPDEQPGLQAKEVREQWPDGGIPRPGIRTVQKDLKYGAESKRWTVKGTGTKTNPMRYAHLNILNSARIESLGNGV